MNNTTTSGKRFKPYEELTISDNFMFQKVMRDPSICKEFLQIILNVPIEKIVYPEEEKVIDITSDGKSIRLDVYLADGKGTIYDLEMQTTETGNLPKRSRYYQGMIDLNTIEKGDDYRQLKKSFVIFICTFDPFGLERYVYSFENRCIEVPELSLDDETYKVFLSTVGTVGPASPLLKELLQYIGGGKPRTPFCQKLDGAVVKARESKEWRVEYMSLLLRDKENQEIGKAEGIEIGIKSIINLCRSADLGKDVAIEKLMQDYKLSLPQAEEKLTLYW